MLISGIQRFTVVDYPDKIACVLFTAGCNFRCGYCHNSEFVLPSKLKMLRGSFIDGDAALSFLEKRKGKLEAVVISGGEPTMMHDLLAWMETIKKMGFLLKLDTNGSHPEVLREALERGLVDYVAMDVKANAERYDELTGVRVNMDALRGSMRILKDSGIDYEFRSVLIKGFHTADDYVDMLRLVRGAKRYRLLRFRPENTLCPAFALHGAFSEPEMERFAEQARAVVKEVIL